MMFYGIYAGSFDPITKGHLDIISRAAKLVDTLIVLIADNPNKKYMFDVDERTSMIWDALDLYKIKNVRIDDTDGLVVDYAKGCRASVMFRGLRPHGDFESEYSLAVINNSLAPQIETSFLIADPKLAAVSSSAVKQLAQYKQDISGYVTPLVQQYITAKTP